MPFLTSKIFSENLKRHLVYIDRTWFIGNYKKPNFGQLVEKECHASGNVQLVAHVTLSDGTILFELFCRLELIES